MPHVTHTEGQAISLTLFHVSKHVYEAVGLAFIQVKRELRSHSLKKGRKKRRQPLIRR